MKSGLAQLVEEKYRFTVETQGIAYTNKHQPVPPKDEDRAWTDDDSDREDARNRRSPPLVQRVANGLTKVLQEGGSGSLTDDLLDRVLAGSLQRETDAAGYDAAKDYIKQILGQLYGNEAPASAQPPLEPVEPRRSVLGARPVSDSAANTTGITVQRHAKCSVSEGGSGTSWPGFPAVQQHASTHGLDNDNTTQEASHLKAPGASRPDPSEAVTNSGPGGDEEERERPRPRPHHGRIMEQLDLLQNADQLAAIISVATTAATTAAAAAVKQSMQTPPPLPPGAFARMHASSRGDGGPAAWRGHPLMGPGAALMGATGLRGAQASKDGDGDDSPDPQPQQREGALVSPHRRSTPLVMMRRPPQPTVDGAEHGSTNQPHGDEVMDGEAELRRPRHQQRNWVQGAATPLHQPVGAAGDGGAPNSNIRVVRLGVPRVTVRTPLPAGPPQGRLFHHQQQQAQGDDTDDGNNARCAAAVGQLPFPSWASALEQGHMRATGAAKPAPQPQQQPGARQQVGMQLQGKMDAGPAAEGPQAPALHDAPQYPLHAAAVGSDAAGLGDLHQPLALAEQQAIVAGQIPANGMYVTGGESIFARAGADVGAGLRGAGFAPNAGAVVAAVARPRRSELPEDVKGVFRSTLAFISDPDGVRAQQQQQQPLSWAAMADVEERKEAQREADELLGGAFDYAAAKRELEQGKRASRLLQGPVPSIAPSAPTAAPAAPPAQPLPAGSGRSGVARGERPRAGAAGAGVAAAAKAPPAEIAAGAVVRGDFAGVLPPAHSVWDVDEAWHDLDAFTKVVEAEVAYRAAAAAAGQPLRVSPGPKTMGPNAVANNAQSGRAVQSDGPSGSANTVAKGQERRPAGGQAAALIRQNGAPEQAARDGARKRAGSPGPHAKPEAAVEDSPPSPERPERKTQPSGSVRIAFGRRIAELPKSTGVEGPKARSKGSPGRGSPTGGRARRTKATGKAARTAAIAAAPGSPSSANDTVQEVLSALASVLMSDADEDIDEADAYMGTGVEEREAIVEFHGGRVSVAQQTAPPAQMKAHADAALPAAAMPLPGVPTSTSSGSLRSVASLPHPQRHQSQDQAVEPVPEMSLTELPAPCLPSTAPIDEPYEAPEARTAEATLIAPATRAPTSGMAAPVWPQPAHQSRPSIAAPAARPQFQFVVDTAHPPVTRLPAWAAAAAKTDGAPAAYVAAAGAAPSGLGLGTPARRTAPTVAVAGAMQVSVGASAADATGRPVAANEQAQDEGVFAATKLPYTRTQHQQLPAFPATADIAGNTHILPPQAAAVAAAAPVSVPTRGRRVPDASQQLEQALMQAVEDEVVTRLAVAQLASRGRVFTCTPEDMPGLVPPLVDYELSQRLVRDVLRENLQSLLTRQQPTGRQDASVGQKEEREATLEEVVAALAAAPVLPLKLQSAYGQQQQQEAAAAPSEQDLLLQHLANVVQDVGITALSAETAVGDGAGIAYTGEVAATVTGSAGNNADGTDGQPDMDEVRSLGDGLEAEASVNEMANAVAWETTDAPPTALVLTSTAVPQHFTDRMQAAAVTRTQTPAAMAPAAAEHGGQLQAQGSGSQAPGAVQIATLGVQAHGVQARGVQAHGVEARGVQAHAMEGRGVQVHAVEGRATQASGVQERATQAAGVMDSSSQADPPPPHYLLQAAMAAGLSYGGGQLLLSAPVGPATGPLQQAPGPDGFPLVMPRPLYLVPADGTQPPSSHALYGINPSLLLPPYERAEGRRPPLNLPGLSKLRDSSDVDSSMESVRRHLKAPGARARAAAEAALHLAASSIDSDEGLMQRSYAQLDMAALTARPVRLDNHRGRASDSSPSSSSQPSSSAAPVQSSLGQYSQLPRPVGLTHAQDQGGHLSNAHVPSFSRNSSVQSQPPAGVAVTILASTRAAGGSLVASGRSLSAGSDAPSAVMSHASSLARSEGSSWARHAAALGQPVEQGAGIAGQEDAAEDPRQGALTPVSAKPSTASRQSGASEEDGAAVIADSSEAASVNNGGAEAGRAAVHASAMHALGPSSAAAEPTTPAVGDDELVGDNDIDDDDDDPNQIHVVDFGSSDGDLDLVPDDSPAPSPGGGAVHGRAQEGALGGAQQFAEGHSEEEEELDEDEVGRVLEAEDADSADEADIGAGSGAGDGGDSDGQAASKKPYDNEQVHRFHGTSDSNGDGDGVVEDYASSRDMDLTVSSSHGGFGGDGDNENSDTAQSALAVPYSAAERKPGADASAAAASRYATGQSADSGSRASSALPTRVASFASSAAVAASEVPSRPTGDGSAASVGTGADKSGDGSRGASIASGRPGARAPSLHSAGDGRAASASHGDDGSMHASGQLHGSVHRHGSIDTVGEEVDLRASLERMARAGLASLEHPRALARADGTSRSGGGDGGLARVMPAVPSALMAPSRPVLTPLQPSAVNGGSVASVEGTMQQPGSPGKPPSLADYHGPTGRLWRPPVAQHPRDPLSSSSETLLASSEASEPSLDPLSRALRGGERRARTAGIVSRVAAAAARGHAMGLADSIEDSSVDISASMDSVSTSAMSSAYNVAGVNLPRPLAAFPTSAATRPARVTEQRLEARDAAGEGDGTEESEESGAEGTPRLGMRQGGVFLTSALARTPSGTGAASATTGRESGRREDAVFRLRQYGARRRKLMQQIGVKDSLLMSSATSLSTDSSTSATSEDGEGLGSLIRRGRL